MTEFGHFHSIGTGACIDAWGAGPFVITSKNGAPWPFEDSDQFGPYILNQCGDPCSDQPGSRSPFWPAYHAWRSQGRRLEADGKTCIWDEPKPTTIMKLRGRQALVIEAGEEDGEVVVLTFDPAHPKVVELLRREPSPKMTSPGGES